MDFSICCLYDLYMFVHIFLIELNFCTSVSVCVHVCSECYPAGKKKPV